jgi:rare lipoprotein A
MKRHLLAFGLAASCCAAQSHAHAQSLDDRFMAPHPISKSAVQQASLPAADADATPSATASPASSSRARRHRARVEFACTGQRIVSAYYWEGKRTATGARFDANGMTAAHRTLPFGTRLLVTNPRTGKSVVVTINDRGPFVRGVSLDLALGAAKAIGMRGTGTVCMAKA